MECTTDTSALQAAFGQPTEQRPGCGVPVARLLGLFHAGTGVLLKLVVAPLLTHDLARVQAVRDRWSIARAVGPLSGHVCGGRRPSKGFPDPAGSTREASMTNWSGG
jgi:hypothetical protein